MKFDWPSHEAKATFENGQIGWVRLPFIGGSTSSAGNRKGVAPWIASFQMATN